MTSQPLPGGLEGLAARCEAATGPWTPETLTPDLIDEFCAAVGAVKGDHASKGWRTRIQLVSALQGSLDAALALVGEKLPNFDFLMIMKGVGEPAVVQLERPDRIGGREVTASTPALALCAALLRALSSHEAGER